MSARRKAPHAARRSLAARKAFMAAPGPRERLAAAYDWLRAADVPDRTVDAVARRLYEVAERADARAAARLSGDTTARLAS